MEREGRRSELVRPDAGLAFLSTWDVGDPKRQRAVLDAIAHTWETRPWPHAGLLSYSVYAGDDGATLMHHSQDAVGEPGGGGVGAERCRSCTYNCDTFPSRGRVPLAQDPNSPTVSSQWRDLDAYDDFFRGAGDSSGTGRDDRNAEIDAAVPGIRRLGLRKTRRLRGIWGPAHGRGPAFVAVTVGADEPVPGSPPGLVAAHLHRTLDDSAYLSYVEWESEREHDAAGGAGQRFRFAYRLVPDEAERD
ncbi:antibiotic biosynthesis monooxygenase [Streptomyces sp. CC224E]|uniref:antibiotic biosynthesis monooxygenase n=1 Tax=Streptomyces sp. CC224E TaxID=3044174 RepID=UPI00278BF652|nr:antibiotic biosynthesis monooxygenase [Streptomyces sp. CC224E]